MRLMIGDDWAEDHHDIEIEDETGRRLCKARLPEGLPGISRLHELIAQHAPSDWTDLTPELAADLVFVGTETDRGPWVVALRAAGYHVFAINPMSSARYRERHSTSGAKSDAGDAHVLAEIVRVDRDHHREIAGDTDLADAVKLLARAHQNLIWERVRHTLRMRSALLEFFPVAVQAFPDLAAADALILLGRAPDPDRAAKLTRGQVVSALTAARRHHVDDRVEPLRALLRQPALRQPPTLEAAYAAVVASQVKVLTALNEQITALQAVMTQNFDRHPAAQIYLSQPGLGPILAARVLGEFGDDDTRFINSRARKNYSGQSPITRASGKKTTVMARYATNRRLGVALHLQAYGALNGSPGTRAYYDTIRARGTNHHAALRQVANRLVGILHGCLDSGTLYDETVAWPAEPINTREPMTSAA
ncbi:IS110 family transposase [Nakamurella sp. PAMC28650]|uniref:IS110 family transposase n=1 Tax=Nakamurella sp. PAMC28650 TaxID=2762325 RepID=UPI00164EC656|nr:IS110 family transposase [Nakamurella sp. PAMC28650]QNK79560.1 IS110 family transposase [Nakamurella sp. PAMC28650]QNK79836.1 IS110 family transposase [Nakamurella sp. PAMC28650]QNK83326.1 IS110 family transposase [Nakamurella sp. PAMC28650]